MERIELSRFGGGILKIVYGEGEGLTEEKVNVCFNRIVAAIVR